MDDEERERYNKLFRFTFGISLNVLHHYFEIRVLDKEEFFYFLDRCKHVLFHALHSTVSCCECKNGSIICSKKAPRLYPDQFNLLFNIENSTLQCLHNKISQYCLCKYSASRSVTIDSLDISLVYAIINVCCPSIHGNPQWINDVKDTRNFLAHKSNCRLTKNEYDKWFTTVENATLDLAKVVGSISLKMIQQQISDFKNDVLSSNAIKDILASSNDDVCKRLESTMRQLVTQESKYMSRDIIDHIKKYKDELSIDINELVFEVKPQICEQLPSQKITEEQDEVDIRIKEILRKKFISDTSNNMPVKLVEEKIKKEFRMIGEHYNVHKDRLKRLVMECFPGGTCKKSKKKKQFCFQNLRKAPDTDDEDESDDGKVEGDIESGETGYATSTPQTAQPQRTQSKNENKCCVVWKFATPDTWNVSKIKDALQHLSCILKESFEIEFVYIGSLVIRTIVPEHRLSNYDDFKSAVRSFLAKIVEVCQLDTDTPTVVKVDLKIFTEIPPTEISTNVNKENKKSTLTSLCHYCKEELVCDNCTTNGRIKLPVSLKKWSSESDIIEKIMLATQMEKSMHKGQMEKSMPKGHMEKSMPKGHMEKSMPKGHMEKGMPKGHIEMSMPTRNRIPRGHKRERLDHIPALGYSDSVTCNVCGKMFTSVSDRRNHHLDFHTGYSDSVACNVCGKMFKTERDRLYHHFQFHTGSKIDSDSVACNVCGDMFKTESARRNHHLNVHTGYSDSVACNVCGKMFTSVTDRRNHHLDFHTGYSDSVACNVCGKMFTSVSDCRNHHLDFHTGSKIGSDSVTCKVCGEMFKTERAHHYHHLNFHTGSKIGSDSVACNVCGEMFKTERARRNHHLNFHSDILGSTLKGEMEERFQKEHMKMRLDYNPSTFKSGTESVKFSQDDSMIDKEIGKIEHFRPIRLEHDITVPKSADILPRWDMKDKDDSKSSTEKH